MRVGVIGGTGNISTAVVRLLLERGHDVTCITRGTSGAAPEGARPLIGDRDDPEWFGPAVRRQGFDAAIDFVCFTPQQGRASLEAFQGVGHLVHTSTVVTLGHSFEWLPVNETHPVRPVSKYGVLKAAVDRMYLAEYYSRGFPVTIIKPSTTYGRKRLVRQLGVDTRWISRILQGRAILKVGDGNAIHHLLHVDDAALGFVGAVERDACIGQIYHLVNPEHTTWDVVHRTGMAVVGVEVEQVGVTAETLLAIDPHKFRMVGDIFAHNLLFSAEKALHEIPEFRPRISLEEGLEDAIGYLLREGLLEDVPRGDWEDDIIAAHLSAIAGLRRRRDDLPKGSAARIGDT